MSVLGFSNQVDHKKNVVNSQDGKPCRIPHIVKTKLCTLSVDKNRSLMILVVISSRVILVKRLSLSKLVIGSPNLN